MQTWWKYLVKKWLYVDGPTVLLWYKTENYEINKYKNEKKNMSQAKENEIV